MKCEGSCQFTSDKSRRMAASCEKAHSHGSYPPPPLITLLVGQYLLFRVVSLLDNLTIYKARRYIY